MARATREVIHALRTTAARLAAGAPYQWGHAGACNCGHLAQTVTAMSKAQIHARVAGAWREYLAERCPVSGDDLDDLARTMIGFGFEAGELSDLEHLDDERILRRLPGGFRYLQRNERDDVVLYLQTWATMLQERLDAAGPTAVYDAA